QLALYSGGIINKRFYEDFPYYSFRERSKFMENLATEFGCQGKGFYIETVRFFLKFIEHFEPTMIRMIICCLKIFVCSCTAHKKFELADKIKETIGGIGR
ncbi:hypothetical protein PFISCL1PPCAC_9808, partial [Pristionchus fissidentatus]